MKYAWIWALALAAAMTTGCATITPEQCQAISPQQQGYADGQKGLTTQNVMELMSSCQSKGGIKDVSVFKNEYLKAYQAGLNEYCTPANGERVGLLGQEYLGVCPKEIEAPFLKEYLYALKQYNDAHPQPAPNYYPYGGYYDPFWDYPFPRTPLPFFHHRHH